MLIIPAIDIYNGKCVRLRQGDYDTQKVYADSPADAATTFCDAGLHSLHIVDLEGAKMGAIKNWKAIESILSVKGVEAQIGGGIRRKEDVQRLLQLGAKRVVIGSLAIESPWQIKTWTMEFGPARIAIAIDIKGEMIAYRGWLARSGKSPASLINEMREFGVRTFICTDIEQDGMLKGPNVTLYKILNLSFPEIELIASGGVSCGDDIKALRDTCSAVIVGKAFYERRITLDELRALNNLNT
ncbi:MAG: 1-(5-phosphoribosyl)-5-[(5-phosphoribosylamino)methylideneamino]imidazole-4-carboxamide isomerase [Ignavibacteriales bacterium]|nr:1-(5-phosphoribosyl)-5-[(5-phosphoribosylamino)methylideneamino]imidazole-4-carboxamide isomerase [Ignavibacteriales bacterium]